MPIYRRGRVYSRLEIQDLYFNRKLLNCEKQQYILLEFDSDNFSEENLIPTLNYIILELIETFKKDFIDDFAFDHAISKILTYKSCIDIMHTDTIFNKLHMDIFPQYLNSNGFVAKYV